MACELFLKNVVRKKTHGSGLHLACGSNLQTPDLNLPHELAAAQSGSAFSLEDPETSLGSLQRPLPREKFSGSVSGIDCAAQWTPLWIARCFL